MTALSVGALLGGQSTVGSGDYEGVSKNPDGSVFRTGAPRPMKMGTIASPWRDDVAAPGCAPLGKSAMDCDLALAS